MSEKILVVDDKQMMRDSVGSTLQRAGFAIIVAADGATALRQAGKHRPSAVVTDLKMPEMDGLELLNRLRETDDQLPVVLMTAYGSIDTAVEAMKAGAFDFVQKPFEGDELVITVKRAVEHRRLLRENHALRTSVESQQSSPVLIGRSPAMRMLAQQLQQVARSHGTVLVSGESGSGKEVVARTIHAHSPRRDRIMLCLNCAALSPTLLESELFGHERGAFTGADQLRKGRFELADGGTLLLDEISEISPGIQAKLLRVLQERQFERVGSSVPMEVDVRVIATTNRDLARCVADGTFRQDLYFRLNVLPIALPPLRARVGDVPMLAEHFLMQVAMREGREPKSFDDDALTLLMSYHWPGNVRELQNICERASVLAPNGKIQADDIRPWLLTPGSGAQRGTAAPGTADEAVSPLPTPSAAFLNCLNGAAATVADDHAPLQTLEETERQQVVHALGRFNGNRQQTARALGIGVRTLGLKLKKWKQQNLVAQSV